MTGIYHSRRIYIVVAVVGGHLWGLEGVLLGGVTSLFLIVGIWKPYFLFSKGFELSIWKYWRGVLLYTTITVISFLLVGYIIHCLIDGNYPFKNWINWIFYAIILTGSFSLFYLSLFYVGTRGMKSFVKRMIKVKK